MEQLVRLLTTLSYEFLGFLVPGLTLILFLVSDAVVGLILIGDPIALHELNDWKCMLERERIYSLPLLAIAVYLSAIFVDRLPKSREEPVILAKDAKQTAKDRRQWTAALLLRTYPKSPKSFGDDVKDVYPAVRERFAKISGCDINFTAEDNGWRQFSVLARSMLRRASRDSLVQNFQNKYTLALSMAYIVALTFWTSIITAILLGLYFQSLAPLIVPAIWAALLIILVPSLLSTHEYYWRYWGSIVVAETALELVPRLGDFDRLEVKILTGGNIDAGWARLLGEEAARCCAPRPGYDE